MASRGLRRDIEGLRAIAVVAVILFHAGVPGVRGGYVGVDVFFVISGFLITGQLVRSDSASVREKITHFYARRVRRIVPAATLVIVATLAGVALFGSPLIQPQARHDGFAAMFFFANIRFASLATDYFHQNDAPSFFQHFWSLSVEEQFYFVWPALMVGAAALGQRRWRHAPLAVVSVVLVASLALGVRLTATAQSNAFFLLPSRAWELAAGAALTLVATRIVLSARSRVALRWAGLALIGAAIVVFDANTKFPGLAALVPVLGAVLVIAAGTNGAETDEGRLLGVTPMQLAGRYSYSLYLWHWPVLLVAGIRYNEVLTDWKRALLLSILVTVPCAVGSYHLVENPFRTRFNRKRDGASLVAAAGVLALGAFTFIPYSAAAATNVDAGRRADPAQASGTTATEFVPSNLTPSLIKAHGFNPNTDYAACRDSVTVCVTGDVNATTSVVLYGDSHARHWISAFDAAGRANHWKVIALTHSGCRSFAEPEGHAKPCDEFRRRSRQEIDKLRPTLVVLSNQSTALYIADRALWRSSVQDAIAALPTGTKAAVLAQTPIAKTDVPLCLATHVRDTRPCEPRPVAVLNLFNEDLRTVTTASHATFVDTTPWLCAADRCPVIVGNVLIYRDLNHFTPQFTATRVGVLATAIRGALGN
jgi:peptidoglycan/LPS O-acetylase OafA/YrhL